MKNTRFIIKIAAALTAVLIVTLSFSSCITVNLPPEDSETGAAPTDTAPPETEADTEGRVIVENDFMKLKEDI